MNQIFIYIPLKSCIITTCNILNIVLLIKLHLIVLLACDVIYRRPQNTRVSVAQ